MKRSNILISSALLLTISSSLLLTTCSGVPAGQVGVKVNKYGSNKGVNNEVLGPGRYWLSWNEDLFLFPTFQQNYTWTKNPHEGSPNDESITFQTMEGMDVNVDVGISYHLNPDKISEIFQKYRKGIEEITDVYLRNSVRDAINEAGSRLTVEDVYGSKKAELFSNVQKTITTQLNSQGIMVDKVYLIGSMRLPENVIHALNAKIEATQRSQQRENEVAEARAQAAKDIATAEGKAKAVLLQAQAEAQANQLKLKTLTSELIRYETIQKWNGELPHIMSGTIPFINVDTKK